MAAGSRTCSSFNSGEQQRNDSIIVRQSLSAVDQGRTGQGLAGSSYGFGHRDLALAAGRVSGRVYFRFFVPARTLSSRAQLVLGRERAMSLPATEAAEMALNSFAAIGLLAEHATRARPFMTARRPGVLALRGKCNDGGRRPAPRRRNSSR